MQRNNIENELKLHDASIESNIQDLANKREPIIKNTKIDGPAPNALLYSLDFELREKHNATPYFFTITSSTTETLEQEWSSMKLFLEALKVMFTRKHFILGGFLATEMHKNSSLKSKRGKNLRSGRPHMHLLLWFHHTFLGDKVEFLSFVLQEMRLNVKVNICKYYTDTVKATLYTLKELKNQPFQTFCNRFGMKSSVILWINQEDVQTLFEKKAQQMIGYDVDVQVDIKNPIPTVRPYKDNALILTELFNKILIAKGFAHYDNWLYERVPGTRFSWDKKSTVDDWIKSTWDFNLPYTYITMLKEGYSWLKIVYDQRKKRSLMDLLPKLHISLYYTEFQDGVYDFGDARFIQKDDVNPGTVCISYHNCKFDDLPMPTLALTTLLFHMYRDVGETKNSRKPISISPTSLRLGRLYDVLENFGSVYHPYFEGNKSPGVFLSGPSSTYKTTIVFAMLNAVRPKHLDTVARGKGAFNLDALKKPDKQSFLWINDDARWKHLGLDIPDYINLLDKRPVLINPKFEKPFLDTLIGSIVTTTNEKLIDMVPSKRDQDGNEVDPYKDVDYLALRKRIREAYLYLPRNYENVSQFFELEPKDLKKALDDEGLGLAIFANTVFVHRNYDKSKHKHVPDTWDHTAREIMTKPFTGKMLDEKNFVAVGKRIVAHIMYNVRKAQGLWKDS